MEILISIFIVSAALGYSSGQQTCLPDITVPCPDRNTTANVILVDNHFPRGKCSSITIDNKTFIYDTVNITKVWINLINTSSRKNCDLNTMAQMKKDLNLNNDSMVIFIEVQEKFFRMIYVIPNNTRFPTITFPPHFEQNLKSAGYLLYPNPNYPDTSGKVCLNGGTINSNYTGAGYRCDCPKVSISFGPRCEYMDRVLNSSIYYFNAFRDPKNIQITFSLYSNGIKKNQSLVTIKNSAFQAFVEVSVSESIVYLKAANNETSITFPIDKQQWNDFYIEISTKNVLLKVSKYLMSIPFATDITDTFLSNYMVLKEDNNNEFNICIRNLKLNAQILDLNNGDGYESCCLDRCECSKYQDCDCAPFISLANTKCFCKIGYDQTNDPKVCIPSALKYSEIGESKSVSYNLTAKMISRIDFKFRTLSTEGTLMFLDLSNPIINITTQIEKTNLMLVVPEINSQSINYNVSDGEIHSVTLNMKIANLEMILDDNANYSVSMLGWSNNIADIQVSSFRLGPLLRPFVSSVNTFTTCFSAIRINGVSDKQYDINLTTIKDILPQCSDGPRCSTGILNCTDNRECNDAEWQNTKCICKANFTSVNSKCIFYKCLVNPCLNDGQCFYNGTRDAYGCLCQPYYSGYNCEIAPPVAAGLWWIAILVVLLLLLIILIVLLVYCCCCRKKQQPQQSPCIKQIHENTVIYNEQAGECDYNGPPINYELMKRALENKGYKAQDPVNPTPDLMHIKLDMDKNNKDLILDHPLEYGYEGYNSDNDSVSSLGSNSTNSQLNTMPLDNSNNRFNYLNELYK